MDKLKALMRVERLPLPEKALSLVQEWAALHQEELLTMWQTQNFKQLAPLL